MFSVHFDTSNLISAKDMEEFYKTLLTFVGNNPHACKVKFFHELKNFPWLKDIDHLTRVNKYRKRHKQEKLIFSDEDVTDLMLIGR